MTQNTPPPGRTPDPVLFGTNPFPEPPEPDDGEEPAAYQRPRWPVVVAILLLVIGLVGALGIWVL